MNECGGEAWVVFAELSRGRRRRRRQQPETEDQLLGEQPGPAWNSSQTGKDAFHHLWQQFHFRLLLP